MVIYSILLDSNCIDSQRDVEAVLYSSIIIPLQVVQLCSTMFNSGGGGGGVVFSW